MKPFWGTALIVGQQSLFVIGAVAFTSAALWFFARRNAETRTQVW